MLPFGAGIWGLNPELSAGPLVIDRADLVLLEPGRDYWVTNSGARLVLPEWSDRVITVRNKTTAAIVVTSRSRPFDFGGQDAQLAAGATGQFLASDDRWLTTGAEVNRISLVEYARTLAATSLTTLPILSNGSTGVTSSVLSAEVTVLSGNQTISSNTNWGSATADDRYTIVRVEGNLTINAGVTVTAAARKLGLVLYVTGSLTINGTLTMTARGANHSSSGSNIAATDILAIATASTAAGRVIPAIGSSDRTKTFTSANAAGNTGNAGSNGGAGSGGTGGGFDGVSTGRGGTCFGGGPGGGAVYASVDGSLNSTAVANGGAGGPGSKSDGQSHGGGAGNPGGLQDRGLGGSTVNGQSGTGGVLIVYAAGGVTIASGAVVSANGVQAHTATATRGGGGSGGGIVRVFGPTVTNSGTVQAIGGVGGPSDAGLAGGAGGAGSTLVEVA
jgi:hypothetical protein